MSTNESENQSFPRIFKGLQEREPDAIRSENFHPGKAGSLFYTAGIPLCRDEISPCNRFSPPKWNEKVN